MFMGDFEGTLLKWDKRMVELVEVYVKNFSVACSSMGGSGPMWAYMGQS